MKRRIEPELVEQVKEVLESGASRRAAAERLRIDERLVRRIARFGRFAKGRRRRPRPRRRRRFEEPPLATVDIPR